MYSTRATFVDMNWGTTNCVYCLMMGFFDILHGLFWLGPPTEGQLLSQVENMHLGTSIGYGVCILNIFCIVLHSIHVVLYAGNKDLIQQRQV